MSSRLNVLMALVMLFIDLLEWDIYHEEAYNEYTQMFDELFSSYEVKKAKNGAMMIRVGNSGSFKFAKKG